MSSTFRWYLPLTFISLWQREKLHLVYSVAPTGPPANVTAFNKSAVAIMVFWERIPRPHRNGIVVGYKVCYKRADSVNSVMYCTVVYAHGIELTGLKPFTPYWVTVLGYTSKGEGPTSEPVKVWTDQFGELCVRNGKLSEASHRKLSIWVLYSIVIISLSL